ncbi:hypothetical protein Pst134EB_016672 [Puccinia striiformis f. sp. tritici]|nr:hypothetical protein Pst134EB_016672 [Puccinia striiformis f. sp. tritici]
MHNADVNHNLAALQFSESNKTRAPSGPALSRDPLPASPCWSPLSPTTLQLVSSSTQRRLKHGWKPTSRWAPIMAPGAIDVSRF